MNHWTSVTDFLGDVVLGGLLFFVLPLALLAIFVPSDKQDESAEDQA